MKRRRRGEPSARPREPESASARRGQRDDAGAESMDTRAEDVDPQELVGASQHTVESSGQRSLEEEEADLDRSTSPEDGLPIGPDELGEKYLEVATESRKHREP